MSLLKTLFGNSEPRRAVDEKPIVHRATGAEPDAFTWLNKQGVRSTAGFEVQTLARFAIEYREGIHVVTLEVEPGSYGGGPSVSISRSAFERWDKSSFRNSPEEQARMLRNFKAAMEFQGLAVSD